MSANPVLERTQPARLGGSPREHAGVLYERYYERVFGYCLYKLGNRQEAEDAAQTTFLWVMRALERGVEPRLEANWLFTVAQNACRARIRARGRKREQESLSDPQILEQVAPGQVAFRDDLFGLEDALRDMPDLQRQAIILREWRGFTYKEIAAELGLTDAAVETLIFRARRSLASRLENPTARKNKRAALALNFGSLSSVLKSVFGVGGAAKFAALAATAAVVGIGLGVQGDTPVGSDRRPAPSPATSVMNEAPPVAAAKPSRPKPEKEREHGGRGSRPASTEQPWKDSSGSKAPAPLLGDPDVETVSDALAPVTSALEPVLDDVKGIVTTGEGTVEIVSPELSQLP